VWSTGEVCEVYERYVACEGVWGGVPCEGYAVVEVGYERVHRGIHGLPLRIARSSSPSDP